jgi:pilus assembly protein CpaB
MGTTRMLILAVAAVSAMALAFIVKSMASGPAPATVVSAPAAPAKPMTKVLVARRDLPIGTRLTAEDLTWLEWPVDAVNVAFITDGAVAPVKVAATGPDGQPLDPAMAEKLAVAGEAMKVARAAIMNDPGGPITALTGAIVKEPMFANEPVTDRKLVRAGQSGYMAVVLQPGMRAMAVPVSVETAAGGFILPGDRVDVLMTRSLGSGPSGGAARFLSETVMRNVRVLAVDQTSTPVPGANAVVGAVATIEVSPADAEALNLARRRATCP